MPYKSINFRQKLELFDEHWKPKVVAEMNDYQFKVVKLQGDFVWHDHRDTDETFIVLEGDLRIDFRDGSVHIATGECSCSQERRAQALRGERGQGIAHLAPRPTQPRPRARLPTAPAPHFDLPIRPISPTP